MAIDEPKALKPAKPLILCEIPVITDSILPLIHPRLQPGVRAQSLNLPTVLTVYLGVARIESVFGKPLKRLNRSDRNPRLKPGENEKQDKKS